MSRYSPLRGVLALALLPAFDAVSQSPVRLPPVIVTANPLGGDVDDLIAPVSQISGERLLLEMQPTLGEIVTSIVGASSSYFGPNASRPVIRGLDGDRIQVLQNGMTSFDASATSVDHALPIDTLTLKRIEVVRGPAALLYGPTAIGGVVNALDNRIPFDAGEGVAAGVDLRYASPATERSIAAFAEAGGASGLKLHADGFKRRTDDLRIPGYAWSPQLRAGLPPEEEGPRDRLPNSASDSHGGAVGAAFVGSAGQLGLSYTAFDSDYGTVAEEDVTIRMQQRRLDFAGRWLAPVAGVKSVDAKVVKSRYEHTEFEGDEAGTTFDNDGWQARLDLVHDRAGMFEGALGTQFTGFDFSASGEERFLPGTSTRAQALFVYEQVDFGGWKLELGGRYDHTVVEADADPDFGPALSRSFDTGALSLGASVDLLPGLAITGSIAWTQRPPNYQELFANGPHLATGIFEVGNREFGVETSTGLEASLKYASARWRGRLGAFVNRFRDYITLYDTGAIDAGSELPIYDYRASKARFQGIEAEATFDLGAHGAGRFELELQGDYLRGTNTSLDAPLPRISPARFGAALVYREAAYDARVDVRRVQSQTRVAPGELATDGYTMLDASLVWRIDGGPGRTVVFVKGTNLLDEDARNHASYIVNIAPLAGRGISAGLQARF